MSRSTHRPALRVALVAASIGLAVLGWLAIRSPWLPTTEVDAAPHPPAHEGTRANRLADESSPYLLLHRFNPVDWYPWGEEALEKARREDKPIFLSVGYSTCYWCHVMERESFSDPEIAARMNQRFVNIKVDREERPDLDEIYMLATQMLSRGRGGWPNSVFLTPSLEPFFAGTYFPPEDGYGRPGFRSVLDQIDGAWRHRRTEVEAVARRVAGGMREHLEGRRSTTSTSGSEAAARAALDQLATRFDAEYGGFGEQPKFPTPSNLALLAHFAGDPAADRMLGTTLDRMARGGLYDQVGGGFHRYATDRAWRVPHFEKMLYDNGALLELYADWHTRHEDAQSARVLRQTAAFLAREMTSPDGGLYSAIDAETDAREGAFYIWRPDALRAALDADEHAWAASILGFDEPPSFRDPHATDEPPTYILHLPRPLAEVAGDAPVKAIERRLDAIRTTLLATRSERPRPLTDDKVLTDWNGLAIAGLADAGRVLGDATMVGQAERAARFVLDHLRPEGRPLQHVWRRGEARIDAFLADYAYLVHGLLALDRATGDARWLRVAIQLTDEQVTRLWDAEGGGFYVATVDPDLLARSKDPSDGARPSANGIALSNLLTLADRTGDARWSSYAVGIVSAFSRELAEMPAGHTTLARGVARLASRSPTSAIDRLRAESRSKVAAVARWTGAGDLAVELSVADGWHVNANPASDELFVPTTLTGDAPTLVEIDYPEGRRFDASYADTPILVYSGSVVLNADVRAPTAGTVRLRVQPCDAQRCLEPVTLDVVVPAP